MSCSRSSRLRAVTIIWPVGTTACCAGCGAGAAAEVCWATFITEAVVSRAFGSACLRSETTPASDRTATNPVPCSNADRARSRDIAPLTPELITAEPRLLGTSTWSPDWIA